MRYHLNPRTGNPGQCKAVKSCPFGDLKDDHYESKEEARAEYERRSSAGLPLTKRPLSVPREEVLNPAAIPELFDRMLEEGYVFNERHRAEQLHELNSREGEHWYSNNVNEFKIYAHRNYDGSGTTYTFRNSRSIQSKSLYRVLYGDE